MPLPWTTGLGCSVAEMRAIQLPSQFEEFLGNTVPGLKCQFAGNEAIVTNPRYNATTSTCYWNGGSSSCSAVSLDNRLCYCKAECPQLPNPPTGTTLKVTRAKKCLWLDLGMG